MILSFMNITKHLLQLFYHLNYTIHQHILKHLNGFKVKIVSNIHNLFTWSKFQRHLKFFFSLLSNGRFNTCLTNRKQPTKLEDYKSSNVEDNTDNTI